MKTIARLVETGDASAITAASGLLRDADAVVLSHIRGITFRSILIWEARGNLTLFGVEISLKRFGVSGGVCTAKFHALQNLSIWSKYSKYVWNTSNKPNMQSKYATEI